MEERERERGGGSEFFHSKDSGKNHGAMSDMQIRMTAWIWRHNLKCITNCSAHISLFLFLFFSVVFLTVLNFSCMRRDRGYSAGCNSESWIHMQEVCWARILCFRSVRLVAQSDITSRNGINWGSLIRRQYFSMNRKKGRFPLFCIQDAKALDLCLFFKQNAIQVIWAQQLLNSE